MADKIEIFEIQIKTDDALNDLAKSQTSVKALKIELKELEKAEGDNSRQIAELTGQLKVEQKELRINTSLVRSSIEATKYQDGSINELKAQLEKTAIKWSRLSKELRENSAEGRKLTKQKTELQKKLKEEENATGDARRNVGNYSESITTALSGNKVFSGSLEGLNDKFLKLAANPWGAVLAAIAAIFATLNKAIQRNEKASENLNKVFAIFKGTMDGLLNALGPLVELMTGKLLKAFEDPKQSIIDLGNIIKDNIINRVKSVLVFGDALVSFFKGDFEEAAKLGADAFIQLGSGIKNGTDKIKEGIEATIEFANTVKDEADKAIKINKELANSELELLRIQKQFELQQLNFQKAAETQRQIRDDESKSIEDRIRANEELGRVLDDQLSKELNLAKVQFDIAEQRQAVAGVTLETEQEVFDARIKIAEITERIDSQRSEQLTNQISLLNEIDQIELDASIAAFENEVQLEIENTNKIAEIRKEARERENEAKMLDFENEYVIAQDNIFATLELERQGLESQRLQELDFAEKIGADTTLVEQKYAKARKEINKAEFNAKLSLASEFASNIATIAGEGTAVGKAASVASAIINTYQAATGAYAALAPIHIVGPVLGAAAAGAALASGRANVKKILSVKSGLPGEGGGGGGGGGGSISASTPSITPVPVSDRASSVEDVNAGIVSRDNQVSQNNGVVLQPTLVVDSVTSAQSTESLNTETSIL